MKKILAFAGSNSSLSINRELVRFAASEIKNHEVKVIHLTDFPLALFSEDLERDKGFPVELMMLNNEIKDADALIVSVNEHNGGVSAFFKNSMDWLSRLDRKFLNDKKILLMSTSHGKRGAATALAYAKDIFPRFGGDVIESFSFPNFSENFSTAKVTITNELLLLGFRDVIQNFAHQIEK